MMYRWPKFIPIPHRDSDPRMVERVGNMIWLPPYATYVRARRLYYYDRRAMGETAE